MSTVHACLCVGAEFKPPSTPFISAGDRVLLEMEFDMLKSSLDEIGCWDDDIVDVCLPSYCVNLQYMYMYICTV